ncbi:MAG: hypothetical protein HLUCCA05_14485 [Roseibaca calidilacus]|uniref:Uncharacterized protein n=1 Tax=Roseibaca calidilacus TaxID=1666912 RepID=A0A0P7YKV7_9RHOB|nr:MAG: hypothetical protein HLUCCA05_14485 [Roseibaca calidilacus]
MLFVSHAWSSQTLLFRSGRLSAVQPYHIPLGDISLSLRPSWPASLMDQARQYKNGSRTGNRRSFQVRRHDTCLRNLSAGLSRVRLVLPHHSEWRLWFDQLNINAAVENDCSPPRPSATICSLHPLPCLSCPFPTPWPPLLRWDHPPATLHPTPAAETRKSCRSHQFQHTERPSSPEYIPAASQ